jgi:hypothetical protein
MPVDVLMDRKQRPATSSRTRPSRYRVAASEVFRIVGAGGRGLVDRIHREDRLPGGKIQ